MKSPSRCGGKIFMALYFAKAAYVFNVKTSHVLSGSVLFFGFIHP